MQEKNDLKLRQNSEDRRKLLSQKPSKVQGSWKRALQNSHWRNTSSSSRASILLSKRKLGSQNREVMKIYRPVQARKSTLRLSHHRSKPKILTTCMIH